jgi:hypothetical protein
MTTYRACYWVSPDGQASTVLTSPDDSSMSDDRLRAAAIFEAQSAGLVYEGERVSDPEREPRIHIDDLTAGLRIGDWKE